MNLLPANICLVSGDRRNAPSLSYYMTDYLRIAPKVMKWCKDHRVPPAPDNMSVPKNVPMETTSVSAVGGATSQT